ncbi:hypothetical protein BGX23_009687 [Mortierella sp. AD031]|nr:hypothetical protein BGX23_009687 [Mortierella sp. AD031]
MTQLLESTRNYLKTSTRLGRHMSNYKLEASSSQSSLNETAKHSTDINNNNSIDKPSSHRKLSGLFNADSGRTKNSFSEDRQKPGSVIHQTKTSPDTQDTIIPSDDNNDQGGRRNSKSSERTHRSRKSHKSHQSSQEGNSNSNSRNHPNHHYRGGDHASAHMEHEVPRGRSPTLSMSNTISTATSYSCNTRPPTATDPASLRQHQSHIWRRNLLEESIMHSLKLGYAERRRSSSRHRSRPSKSDSPRARKTREQAMLAAALGRDVPLGSVPESAGRHAFDVETLHEEILDRSIVPPPPATYTSGGQQQQKQPTFRREKNSPYQLEYNSSMTNITQTFTSFTLELPEHQVSRIITCSAIPDLFKIKTNHSGVQEQRPRSRRNSRTLSPTGGIAPSPRVLTGARLAPQQQQQQQFHQHQAAGGLLVEKVVEEESEEVSPITAPWVQSVFALLDETMGPKQQQNSTLEHQLPQADSLQAAVFKNERKMQRGLKKEYENVLPLLDSFRSGQYRFMDYYGPVFEEQTRKWAKDIVTHCDIKPANMLVTRDLRIRVANFGLSKQTKVNKFMLNKGFRNSNPSGSNQGAKAKAKYVKGSEKQLKELLQSYFQFSIACIGALRFETFGQHPSFAKLMNDPLFNPDDPSSFQAPVPLPSAPSQAVKYDLEDSDQGSTSKKRRNNGKQKKVEEDEEEDGNAINEDDLHE